MGVAVEVGSAIIEVALFNGWRPAILLYLAIDSSILYFLETSLNENLPLLNYITLKACIISCDYYFVKAGTQI